MNQQRSSSVELVRQYGMDVSHAALNPSFSSFWVSGIDGLIGFQVFEGYAVVYGDPICHPDHREELGDAFAVHCRANGWTILYVAADGSMQAYAQERGYGTLEFADSLRAENRRDPENGHEARHLRRNLNQTRRLGVEVREYPGEASRDARLEAEAEAAYKCWQSSRHGFQMYLGSQGLFADRLGHRWFVAIRFGRVVGVLSMLDVCCGECHHLINLVFSTPAAPRHTNDLMVITALRALRESSDHSICFGIGPRRGLGRIHGFDGVSAFLARRLYEISARVIPLHSKTAFWEKFGVTQREPLYLLFQEPRLGIGVLTAFARAFRFSVT